MSHQVFRHIEGDSSSLQVGAIGVPETIRRQALPETCWFSVDHHFILKLFCSLGTNVPDQDAWQDVEIKASRNLPKNLQEEVQTARDLEGIVSRETQLSVLSVVDNVKDELDRIEAENAPSEPPAADLMFGAGDEQ